MTRQEKINQLVQIYNEQRKWQKLIYDECLDMDKVNVLTDEELDAVLANVQTEQ